jgi:hypothetical protein
VRKASFQDQPDQPARQLLIIARQHFRCNGTIQQPRIAMAVSQMGEVTVLDTVPFLWQRLAVRDRMSPYWSDDLGTRAAISPQK